MFVYIYYIDLTVTPKRPRHPVQTTIICCRDSLPSEARDLVVCDRLPPATDDVSTSLGPDGPIWSLRVSKRGMAIGFTT